MAAEVHCPLHEMGVYLIPKLKPVKCFEITPASFNSFTQPARLCIAQSYLMHRTTILVSTMV